MQEHMQSMGPALIRLLEMYVSIRSFLKRKEMTLPAFVGVVALLSACSQDNEPAWAANFDSAAQQFQLIRQAQAQESNATSPQARMAYENMQVLWDRMGRARSGMMQSMRGRGMMGRFGMGGGMMSQPMMMQFNEMNQQMLSYCLGMQQMMDEAGNAGMAGMYGQMADRMEMLLSRLPPSTGAAPTAQQGAPPASDGAATYASNCAGCHGARGEGIVGAFPPLNGSAVVDGVRDVPVKIVLHGLQGPLTVAGVRYDGLMPAFGSTLTDAEIAAALTYVRSLPSNKGGAVTSEDVQNMRNQTVSRGEAFTPNELRLE